MSHDVGIIGHVLKVGLQKKGHHQIIVVSMRILPHGSGNFGHNQPLENFDSNWGNFFHFVGEKHQQRSGNAVSSSQLCFLLNCQIMIYLLDHCHSGRVKIHIFSQVNSR